MVKRKMSTGKLMARPWLKFLLMFVIVLGGYLAGFSFYSTGDVIPNELLPISLLREGNFFFDEFFFIAFHHEEDTVTFHSAFG